MSETTRTLRIEGMHCGACVANITEALEEVSGVRRAKVDLAAARADVTADDTVPTDALVAAVTGAGDFRATPA